MFSAEHKSKGFFGVHSLTEPGELEPVLCSGRSASLRWEINSAAVSTQFFAFFFALVSVQRSSASSKTGEKQQVMQPENQSKALLFGSGHWQCESLCK